MESGCAGAWGEFSSCFQRSQRTRLAFRAGESRAPLLCEVEPYTGGLGSSFNLGEQGKWIASRSFQTFL